MTTEWSQLESLSTRLAGLQEALGYYIAQVQGDVENVMIWPDHVTQHALLLSQASSLVRSILGVSTVAPIHTDPPRAEELLENPLLRLQVHPVQPIKPEQEHVVGMLLSTRHDNTTMPYYSKANKEVSSLKEDSTALQEELRRCTDWIARHDGLCARALDAAITQSNQYDWAIRLQDDDEDAQSMQLDTPPTTSLSSMLRFINRGVLPPALARR